MLGKDNHTAPAHWLGKGMLAAAWLCLFTSVPSKAAPAQVGQRHTRSSTPAPSQPL